MYFFFAGFLNSAHYYVFFLTSKVGAARFFLFIMLDKEYGTNSTIVSGVELLAQPILDELGLELIEIQYRREQIGWVLRLIIYKKGGVGLEDCSQLSRQLGYVLEVEDIIDQHFHLEVSSPGLDRLLTKTRDFERNIGQKVTVSFRASTDVDDVCIGRIDSVDDQAVTLYTQNGKHEIQLDDIIKARLVIEF